MSGFWQAIINFFTALFKQSTPVTSEPTSEPTTTPSLPSATPRPVDLPASNHYVGNDATKLGGEYAFLWSICTLVDRLKDQATTAAKKALSNKARYKAVADRVGCPWYFIAVIHFREASFNWNSNIADGDPWNKITTHVPVGRGPFASWEDAAIDALTFEGYANLTDWSLGSFFRRLESYNGWGYRIGGVKDFVCKKQGVRLGTFDGIYHGSMQDTLPKNASPYIYNGTPFYQQGVSIEDHSFYPGAIDDQVGCMALLKALELQGEVLFGQTQTPAPTSQPKPDLVALAMNNAVSTQAASRLQVIAEQKFPGHSPRYWAVVDFSQHSKMKRLAVIDTQANIVEKYLVAHGSGSEGKSDDGYADVFSNVSGSNASSLGVYRVAESYTGKHGLSAMLDGLEDTNPNARFREIVLHGADYVSDDYIKQYGRIGRSEGCPAVEMQYHEKLVNQLKDGSFLIMWTNRV